MNPSKETDINVADETIPKEISAVIEEETGKDIAFLLQGLEEEDTETAEFYKDLLTDIRGNEYLFLNWLNQQNPPQKVLYMGSGFDVLPKKVFGEEKVTHVSMEDYRVIEGITDEKYFPKLGTGEKAVADASAPPFPNDHFDLIFLQDIDLSSKEIGAWKGGAKRILKNGGMLAISKNMLSPDSSNEMISSLSGINGMTKTEVPVNLQGRGEAVSEFILLKIDKSKKK